MGLGGWELLAVLAIILLLFGAKRLPDLAGSLGTSIKEFRKATDGDDGDGSDGPDGSARSAGSDDSERPTDTPAS